MDEPRQGKVVPEIRARGRERWVIIIGIFVIIYDNAPLVLLSFILRTCSIQIIFVKSTSLPGVCLVRLIYDDALLFACLYFLRTCPMSPTHVIFTNWLCLSPLCKFYESALLSCCCVIYEHAFLDCHCIRYDFSLFLSFQSGYATCVGEFLRYWPQRHCSFVHN